jgi:microcystin degradation protein MlrC
MIAPAHAYTTKSGGLLALKNKAQEMVSSGRILDYTIFEVQPWLDACEMAACIIVIAEEESVAADAARELALDNFALRKELLGKPLMSVEEVIEKALANKTGKPVILVDSSDSRGAGSTADSAAVLEYLLPHADTLRCALGVSDAPAVEKAFEVGVGNRADFTLGATIAPELSSPVKVENALVRSLHNGYFTSQDPMSRGSVSYCGKVAVLQVGKILIQVSTNSQNEKDTGFFRGFGIEPTLCDLVSVKACTSFRAAYEPISAEICNAATPGAAGTVLTDLPYKKRPVPMYPFEEISEDDISEAKSFR